MGGLNVKNTMIERLLQMVAPHPCLGCGKVGLILCDYCKYDIINDPFVGCILCGTPQGYGVCEVHPTAVQRAFVVSERSGTVKVALDVLKFHRNKAAALPLAELLHERLPLLPADAVVTAIPTVGSHIRQRGYDQAEVLARHFASSRSLPFKRLLRRKTKTTQHIVGKELRLQQADEAFALATTQSLEGVTVVLVDDIITTGATVSAAAAVLASAGATVWCAAVAYQPLD